MNNKIIVLTIALIVMMNMSMSTMAETVKLLENTDKCIYNPKIDKDYCYSIYEICDTNLTDVEAINFKYKRDIDSRYNDNTISTISNIKKTISPVGLCYNVKIEAFKNHFVNVDNVLCTKERCYYQWVWWNSSVDYRSSINASCAACSANVTMYLLINDTAWTNGTTEQYIWCNYTVSNGTLNESLVGWIYWNDETEYYCVNPNGTEQVMLNVELGNGTNYGTPDESLLLWAHLNGSGGFDSSRYAWPATTIGTPAENISGIIDGCLEFRDDYAGGETNESISYGDMDEIDGVTALTVMGWSKMNQNEQHAIISKTTAANIETMLASQHGYFFFVVDVGGADHYAIFDFGDYADVQHGIWHHVAGTYDGETVRLYVNGTLMHSETAPSGAISSNSNELRIGHTMTDNYYDAVGPLDEVRVYNRTLSDDEIYAIWANQVGNMQFTALGDVEVQPPAAPTPNVTVTTLPCSVSPVYRIVRPEWWEFWKQDKTEIDFLIDCAGTPYGEMWNYSANASAWVFSIAAQNTYYNLTGLACSDQNGFVATHATQAAGGSYLTANNSGLYLVSMSLSFEADGGDALYGISVSHGFDVDTHRDCYARRWSKNNQPGNVGITCLMDIDQGDQVNIQIENEENTRDIKVHTVNLNLVRVGDLFV